MSLNDEQKKAVYTVEGRVLVLAGAGSGKTKVLTTRIAHLILKHQVSPQSILGLTFTNKAAQEMRQRIEKILSKKQAKEICLSTFHSFCMNILKENIHHLGFTQNFSLYDEKDVMRLVKMIARDLLEHEGELPSLAATMQMITQARNKGQAPHQMIKTGSKWHDEFAETVFSRLQDSMRAYNAVDFDHLLSLTVNLFERHPDVLDRYQERYRFIMIDEYQDTNPVQFRLAALLSSKYNNLCVVGDDDQAIYGWRGAEVKNILSFDQASIIKLEQNYRSTDTILQAANAVISHNKERYPKALWSQRGKGPLIEVFVAPGEKEEAEAVAGRIAKLRGQGIPFNEMAILYRSNALSRSMELALMKQSWQQNDKWMTGVPFQVYGGTEFYERREVKDLLAYLKVIINPLDHESLLRIINHPRRGIGEKALDHMTTFSRKKNVPLWEVFKSAKEGQEDLSEKAKESLRNFIALLEEAALRFKSRSLSETLVWLIEKINFKKGIEEDVKSDKMRQFKWENVESFIQALKDYEQNPRASLREFVSNMALDIQLEEWAGEKNREDKVHLMTFHSAKGLEFEVCFLVGVEDHIIPHEKSLKENGLEEERRLMYVALTRAKTYLILSMVKERKRLGKDAVSRPSRFLFEIPKELMQPKAWHEI
ncbi:ATP-dependent DNA helicase PcrA [Chlamydiales bacterium STE3]|nr:ATP-dependent DNA helicase PcrA [Chlamydiales bacterium STE3]